MENIHNEHVFEGMVYGCIVLTNSEPLVKQTNGIALEHEKKETKRGV